MARNLDESRSLQRRAERLIPGGVNSPVRAFRSVGSEPPFLVRGEGAHIWDADGNRYIDYVGSWGPLILGHAHPEVIEAIVQAARKGTMIGTLGFAPPEQYQGIADPRSDNRSSF